MLTEFNLYLAEQVKEPYLWGGQHTKLTPENYKAVIAKRESVVANRRRVEAYCEKMFAKGYTVLYAYDCSGLGMYWLENVKHIYKSDMTANGMMGQCVIKSEKPKMGWWVFKKTGARATHIGYMVDDEHVIQAAGRDLGVTRTKFKAKDWSCWGIPQAFRDDIVNPEPTPPSPTPEQYVEVVGGSVNVRVSDSKKGKILFTAHRGDTFPFVAVAPSGWYEILTAKGDGFITNLPQYTKLV